MSQNVPGHLVLCKSQLGGLLAASKGALKAQATGDSEEATVKGADGAK